MKKLFLLFVSVVVIGLVGILVDEQREVGRLKKISPVFSKTLPVVQILAENEVFELQLYENDAAEQLLKSLPQTMVMTRWGEGAYGGLLKGEIPVLSDKKLHRRAFFKGEVVVHQKGKALFLMFGPTPSALMVDSPMLLGFGGVPVGRIKDYSALEQFPGVVEFSIQAKQ